MKLDSGFKDLEEHGDQLQELSTLGKSERELELQKHERQHWQHLEMGKEEVVGWVN